MGITGKQRGQVVLPGLGVWKDVPFDPANFTASNGMTITLDPAKILVNRYCVVGNLVHWHFFAHGMTLGGNPANQIQIQAPTPNMVARYAPGHVGYVLSGSEEFLCMGQIAPQQLPNWPANMTIVPHPIRTFTLGTGTVQLKFAVFYEYGKSNLMP